jgi:hypothetical protein
MAVEGKDMNRGALGSGTVGNLGAIPGEERGREARWHSPPSSANLSRCTPGDSLPHVRVTEPGADRPGKAVGLELASQPRAGGDAVVWLRRFEREMVPAGPPRHLS